MDTREFKKLAEGRPVDLAAIALEMASDLYPELDRENYFKQLNYLSQLAQQRCPFGTDPIWMAHKISELLFAEQGFRSNEEDYYDPRNSYLNEVLDRKLGIPISLSLLYLLVARRTGLWVEGVNFPGHFLLRAGHGANTFFIDPYHGGNILDAEGCQRLLEETTKNSAQVTPQMLASCPPGVFVARMLRNLKLLYFERNDFERAYFTIKRLMLLSPSDPLEARDLGMSCLHSHRPKQALQWLETYVSAHPEAPDAPVMATLMSAAYRELRSQH